MKQLIMTAGAACVFALGVTSALAAPAKHGQAAHSRPAVWMRIRFPGGNAPMAIAYDNSLVSVARGTVGAPSGDGWGFRPILEQNGKVKVKVYRLHLTAKGKIGKHPQYLETLSPNPVATTTKGSDRHIQVRIMSVGPEKKLVRQLREFEHIAKWQP